MTLPACIGEAWAPVSPEDLLDCFTVARATGWSGAGLGQEVDVLYGGEIVTIDGSNPVGAMMLAARRCVTSLPRERWLPLSGRLLLLFDLLMGSRLHVERWVRAVRGGFDVHPSLVRAAAVAPVLGTDVRKQEFDQPALADIARRFDFEMTHRDDNDLEFESAAGKRPGGLRSVAMH